MKEFERKRRENRTRSNVVGITLALAVHFCAIVLFKFTGVTYLYPPPQEQSVLLDFEDKEVKVEKVRGKEPRSENVDKTKPVELVQRSESPVKVSSRNLTPASKPDEFGDVDQDTPPMKEEPKLDPRASFPGMARRDTTLTSPHSAETPSGKYKAGQTDGNTTAGQTDAMANAHLKGRNVAKGGLKKPVYNVQESGTVVVDIEVDQYGKVVSAKPGADGTTVTDMRLWNAARVAALETVFNQDGNAPVRQKGTITYYFKLK